MENQEQEPAKPKRNLVKTAAVVGFVLAVVCNSLPQEYRTVCHTIAQICTGGF